MSLTWFSVPTPLPCGPMRVGVTDQGVAAATHGTEAEAGLPRGAEAAPGTADRRVVRVTEQIGEYFAGRRRDLELPIDWRLTVGPQQAVLRTLERTVRFGQTITYGELAVRSGVFDPAPEQRGLAARTVGSIAASNPVSLLIPCHRLVAADGLGGFGGPDGMAVKRWLLTLEGVLAPTLDWADQ